MPKGKSSHKGKGQYALYKAENREAKNKEKYKKWEKTRQLYFKRRNEKFDILIPQEINKFINASEIKTLESYYDSEKKADHLYEDAYIHTGPKSAKGRAINKFTEHFYKKTKSSLPRGRVRQYLYTKIFDKLG